MTIPEWPLRGPSSEDLQKSSDQDSTPATAPRSSRRAQRQARERRNSVASIITPLSKTASKTAVQPVHRVYARRPSTGALLPNISLSTAQPSMPPARNLPLFVASIGNPGATYANTLHSAGHTVLDQIRFIRCFTPFQKDRQLANGLVSTPVTTIPRVSLIPFVKKTPLTREVQPDEDNWTLWQSPSLMNVSGVALRTAWQKWSKQNEDGILVVLHDELEKPLGSVTIKRGGSAKGHNGLKSIQAHLGNTQYVKIGIGIGRPTSREPAAVAKYVLRKMTTSEWDVVGSCAGPVIELLREVHEGKR